jgi:hypothetical protein
LLICFAFVLPFAPHFLSYLPPLFMILAFLFSVVFVRFCCVTPHSDFLHLDCHSGLGLFAASAFSLALFFFLYQLMFEVFLALFLLSFFHFSLVFYLHPTTNAERNQHRTKFTNFGSSRKDNRRKNWQSERKLIFYCRKLKIT